MFYICMQQHSLAYYKFQNYNIHVPEVLAIYIFIKNHSYKIKIQK